MSMLFYAMKPHAHRQDSTHYDVRCARDQVTRVTSGQRKAHSCICTTNLEERKSILWKGELFQGRFVFMNARGCKSEEDCHSLFLSVALATKGVHMGATPLGCRVEGKIEPGS